MSSRWIVRATTMVVWVVVAQAWAAARHAGRAADVTLTDDGTSYVLANEFVTARVSKTTGDLVSLKYQGLEMMGYVSGHHAGYWEQNPSGAARTAATMTINPVNNAGDRAEVSIKGWADGHSILGHAAADPAAAFEANEAPKHPVGPPPGSTRPANAGTAVPRSGMARGPGMIVDLELRYSLGRNDHGIYTYAIYTHPAAYGATSIGESRFGMKLNAAVFDWLSVDAQRNGLMPSGVDWDHGTDLNMKEARRLTTGPLQGKAEHKYDYCADQFETPAYGWSSTQKRVGLYVINPSMEYLSAGPTHFELTGHIDDGDGGDPVLLDYWRGSHYGGSELNVAEGETWGKVVGPIFVYVNSAATPDAMFSDAKVQAKKEAERWPYAWVQNAEYVPAAERGGVSGRLVLQDPETGSTRLPNLLVGLSAPEATPVQGETAGRFGARPVTWQNDAKHYEFWVHGDSNGTFHIPKVRPGVYELHALADGVLGEFTKTEIVVAPGKESALGSLTWTPVRYGKQLWQIGIPNRSASEFLMGSDHWHWGLYLKYSELFPHDVDYTVGKSDPAKDWFIYQVPHVSEGLDTGRTEGRATTWTIHFEMPAQQTIGDAVLRVGLSGVGTRSLAVRVNDQDAGTLADLRYNATINRDGIEGSWVEKDLRFKAGLLHPGANVMTLTVPAGNPMSGLAYDVLRLELAP